MVKYIVGFIKKIYRQTQPYFLHNNILLIRAKMGHNQASYRNIRGIKILRFIFLPDDMAKSTLF
jgi:hypothetical protein